MLNSPLIKAVAAQACGAKIQLIVVDLHFVTAGTVMHQPANAFRMAAVARTR
jgi:hypothetical protein